MNNRFFFRIIIYYVVDYPLSALPNSNIMTMYVTFSLILLVFSITAVALYIGFNVSHKYPHYLLSLMIYLAREAET